MYLDTIIFFSDVCQLKPLNRLLADLTTSRRKIYWNPSIDDTLILNPKHTLIVTDNEYGSSYANRYEIPYIEKWSESYSSLPQKPVCYYDCMSQLTSDYLTNQWKRAHGLPLTISNTARLILRELTTKNIPALYAIRERDEILAHLPAMDSLESELEKHTSYIKNQYEFFDYGLWGVFLKNGTLIGQAGIQNKEYQDKCMLELSYLIAPEYQKKGYASEAIIAIYEYAIERLECNQMIAIIAKNNLASIRTAMNLGMKRQESVEYLGHDCNYYINDNLSDFLVIYKSEQKRVRAARSAYDYAQKKPVQEVYTRYRSAKRVKK